MITAYKDTDYDSFLQKYFSTITRNDQKLENKKKRDSSFDARN